MGPCANGGKCGVWEWVKKKALRWFCHLERKKSVEFVKKVYVCEIMDLRRGKPFVKWNDRVKDCMPADRGRGLEQARMEFWIWRGGGSSAGDVSRGSEAPETIDR